MDNIAWLDGKDANGKFILEILFSNGKTGYLKNSNLEVLNDYQRIFRSATDIVKMTIYDPAKNVVSEKSKMAVAA